MATSYNKLWKRLVPLYDSDEAQAIVRLVLDSRFGMTLTDIACGGVERLTWEETSGLETLVSRLEQGEPVQYVLGEAWFCGRRFHVEPGVLIPRPETEQLCRLVIEGCKSPSPAILDVGTGSGCIAVTLALDIPGAAVSATDISGEALRIARGNAETLKACVSFFKQDILTEATTYSDGNSPSAIDGGASLSASGDKPQPSWRFDAIVSNPPYITVSEKDGMRGNVVDHEPSLALFVPDDDALRFYRAIGRYAIRHLAPGGSLYFEINPLFADELKAMLEDMGFSSVTIINDNFGKRRFAKGLRIG